MFIILFLVLASLCAALKCWSKCFFNVLRTKKLEKSATLCVSYGNPYNIVSLFSPCRYVFQYLYGVEPFYRSRSSNQIKLNPFFFCHPLVIDSMLTTKISTIYAVRTQVQYSVQNCQSFRIGRYKVQSSTMEYNRTAPTQSRIEVLGCHGTV